MGAEFTEMNISVRPAKFIPVAAIIPVANRPGLLGEAIQSICAGQTKPTELIVVLNATDDPLTDSDSAGPLLDSQQSTRTADRQAAETSFARHADSGIQFRVIECEIAGPGPARNAGVATTQQPWLAFLDSDDLWAPEKLNRQWSYLTQRPHLNAIHTAEVWIKDGRTLSQPAHLRPHTGRFLRASLAHCLISCSSLLIRREVFAELGEFDPDFRVCEDFELWLRYLTRYPIGLLPEALTIKRAGDWPQESRRFHSLDAYRIRAILKLIRMDGHRLSSDEFEAARSACEKKIGILQQGAARRDTIEKIAPLAAEIKAVFAEFYGESAGG